MKIVIIGSGNLATNLSLALRDAGMPPCQVFSKTLSHAQELANKIGCPFTNQIEQVIPDADAYLISVKDDAIHSVAEQLHSLRSYETLRYENETALRTYENPSLSTLNFQLSTVIHTAGSVSIDVFSGLANHSAVLYPMQSFTKGRGLNFKDIPCFVEATDELSLKVVTTLANAISDKVVSINSEQRRRLHLAAVFASNLTNHCYRIAERIINKENLDFNLFHPLILETAKKACSMSPKQAQTGPMVRNDVTVMSKQLELIDDPLLKDIYQLMAQSIHNDALSAE